MQYVGFFSKNSQKCILLWGIENNINTYAGLRTTICQYSHQYCLHYGHVTKNLWQVTRASFFQRNCLFKFLMIKKYQKDIQNICIWNYWIGQAKLLIHSWYSNIQSQIYRGKFSFNYKKHLVVCQMHFFVPVVLVAPTFYYTFIFLPLHKNTNPGPKYSHVCCDTKSQKWKMWHNKLVY